MQGIHRRGPLLLAGLIGAVIGVLVVAGWASPAGTWAVLSQGEQADGLKMPQAGVVVDTGVATDPASQLRVLHDALAAKQQVEAEYYPGHVEGAGVPQTATDEANVNAAFHAAGPLDLHEVLRAKQQVEAEYYPGRSASLRAGQAETGVTASNPATPAGANNADEADLDAQSSPVGTATSNLERLYILQQQEQDMCEQSCNR